MDKIDFGAVNLIIGMVIGYGLAWWHVWVKRRALGKLEDAVTAFCRDLEECMVRGCPKHKE